MSPLSSCCDRRARVREVVERPQGGKKGRWVRAPAGGRRPSSVHQDPERRRGVRHHLPVGALPSRAAALAPRSPTLLTTWFAGKVRSMMMMQGKGTPAPRLGFAPLALWKGRNPAWAETGPGSTRPGIFTPFPPHPLTDRGLGSRQPPHLRGGRGRGGRGLGGAPAPVVLEPPSLLITG